MKSEKYATVKNKHIISLTDAFPAHELGVNQIPLTAQEYRLLQILPVQEDGKGIDLNSIFSLMDSITSKVECV